nr:hypothetical protein [Kitasatospora cheerisanensis]
MFERVDAALDEVAPQPLGGGEFMRFGVLGSAVPAELVLQADQQAGGARRVEFAGAATELGHRFGQQLFCAPDRRVAAAGAGQLADERRPGVLQGAALHLGQGRAHRGEAGHDRLSAASRGEAGEGGRGGERAGLVGGADRSAVRRTAVDSGAQEGPPAARRDAQRLLDDHLLALEGLGERGRQRAQLRQHGLCPFG